MLQASESHQAVVKLNKIHGVGAATAEEWFKMGIRNPEEAALGSNLHLDLCVSSCCMAHRASSRLPHTLRPLPRALPARTTAHEPCWLSRRAPLTEAHPAV